MQQLWASVPIIFLLISRGCYDCIQINEVNFSPSSLLLICGALLRKSAHVVLCSSPPMCCLMRTRTWCLGRLQGSRCNLHLHWGGCVESCTILHSIMAHLSTLSHYCITYKPSICDDRPAVIVLHFSDSDRWFQNNRSHQRKKGEDWPITLPLFDHFSSIHLLTKAAGITGKTSLAGNQIHFRSFKLQTVLGDNYI